MEEGVTWILKGAACVTVKEKVALCVIVPLVPVTLTVVVPVGVVWEAASWNAVPCACPVREITNGLDGVVVAPDGNPEIVKLIDPVNPLSGFA